MKIVFLDAYTLDPGDNPLTAISALGTLDRYERTPRAQIIERAGDADVIIANKTEIDAELIAKLPKCKLISVTATGYNIIDVKAARAANIAVCNVPAYSTDSVAQFTFALILELCHHVGLHSESVKAGDWVRSPDFCYWKSPLIELAGKSIAIVGFGRIGERTAEIARAFGMKVVAVKRNDPVHEAIKAADFVSLHCPLTDATKGLVNKTFLSHMKKSAFLINTSRGPLVVEQDLADALNAGTIAGAGVDVVSAEPMKAGHPLLAAKNCIITPHIAWCALEARQRLAKVTADNIASFIAGSPINVVN